MFCSDGYLLEINLKYLKHNTYTDIITFNLSDSLTIEGEVYVSIDRVEENALRFKNSFETELLRVVIHGALHLCGYKDKTKTEKSMMRQKEDEYIRLYQKSLSS
jgi:rRNA maturation RNase YbeY